MRAHERPRERGQQHGRRVLGAGREPDQYRGREARAQARRRCVGEHDVQREQRECQHDGVGEHRMRGADRDRREREQRRGHQARAALQALTDAHQSPQAHAVRGRAHRPRRDRHRRGIEREGQMIVGGVRPHAGKLPQPRMHALYRQVQIQRERGVYEVVRVPIDAPARVRPHVERPAERGGLVGELRQAVADADQPQRDARRHHEHDRPWRQRTRFDCGLRHAFAAGSSIRTRIATRKLGIVATMTHRKKCGYPMWSCSQPLHMPGNIMPMAMKPVQMA